MKQDLKEIRDRILQAVSEATDIATLDEVETVHLGRKSEFSQKMKGLGGLSADERKAVGQLANEIKEQIRTAVETRRDELKAAAYKDLATADRIDVTVPGEQPEQGHRHLTSQAINDIVRIFSRLGFTRERHPEVDWDWFTFESLNMPPDHPARDEWETFFVDAPVHKKKGKMVLTPHTTSGTARELKKGKLPIRMMNIGKTFRRQIDVSHTPMFHQFEGLLVDRDVSVTHLKGVLDYFASEFFGAGRRTRLRPFHFRFTEPSFEIDIKLHTKGRKPRWIEIAGCGMVDPAVFEEICKSRGDALYDPDKVTGFAFGMGLDRLAMIKWGIRDIRLLIENDTRFLSQFA